MGEAFFICRKCRKGRNVAFGRHPDPSITVFDADRGDGVRSHLPQMSEKHMLLPFRQDYGQRVMH